MIMENKISIRRVCLRNWKNFSSADVAIRDRFFLVGPNASGKSNFLDVFRFLRDLSFPAGGFHEAVGRRGGVGAIRCLAARRNPDITVHIELEQDSGDIQWSYTLRFHQDSQRRPMVRSEQVSRNGIALIERPDEQDRKDRVRLTQTHLEQVNMNTRFRELAGFFKSIRYLHIVPQLIRQPERSVGRSDDPFGGDFLQQIAHASERTRRSRLKRIQNALQIAVPQLEEIDLWRDDRGIPHLRGRYRHWRQHGAWQSEEQFSDGTLRLLGLLWAAMDTGGPLLLEEPELSLHPQIIRAVPQMLAQVQWKTGRQVFLSTHSADLLQDEGIGLDEALLILPRSEGVEIIPASSMQECRALLEGGLSLAEVIIPKTAPAEAIQLFLFGDS